MDAALERALLARGATLGQILGVRLPLRFTDLDYEWRAARERCAVWAANFRALIAATGEDRVSFLQGMLSNDVKALAAGEGVPAAFLTQQGKIVVDLCVLADQDKIMLDLFAERAEPFMTALGRFIVADDVELVLAAGEQPLCGLSGPSAREVIGRLLDRPPAPWRLLHHEVREFRSTPIRVVAASELGEEGYLVCGPDEIVAPFFEAACEAGAVPAGMEALNVLRVEAGIPWYGADTDEDVLIMEAGLERAISFSKGCYLGQEVVERIAARGHVNKKLCGLLIEGDVPPPPGALLRAGGRDIGRLTSVVRSPGLGRIIALGYVHRDHLTPGTALTVAGGDTETPAAVSALPFVP
jgi:folate-binding protein YgfZ